MGGVRPRPFGRPVCLKGADLQRRRHQPMHAWSHASGGLGGDHHGARLTLYGGDGVSGAEFVGRLRVLCEKLVSSGE